MEKYNMSITAIQDAIAREDYQEADRLYHTLGVAIGSEQYNGLIAILDASIGAATGDRERVWEAVRAGLAVDSRNYELYVILGNYYLESNLDQAYLCYENALFYCSIEEDKIQISTLMEQLRQEYHVQVRRAAFVILSYDLLNYTRGCIESIRNTVPKSAREIIVVDNASKDGSLEWLQKQPDIRLIANKQNQGFPIGCNQGIAAAAAGSDIFLLNNDTLMTENALFWLRMGLYSAEDVGAAGSVSNYVANGQMVAQHLTDRNALLRFGRENNIPMKYPYEPKLFLIGFALLIKRSVLDQIGVLDERFTPGNCEDEDYGLRVVKAGYRNLLCKNSFILHFGSKSFKKAGVKNYAAILKTNSEKMALKWGMNMRYYLYPRPELADQIEKPAEEKLKVLDIGCGCGALMGYVRGRFPNAETYGIELVQQAAELAAVMGNVICADVEQLSFPWAPESFDYVIMGDVLEHLRNPADVLRKVRRVLKRGGHIVVSMPNMKHFSVFLPLLMQDVFPYADAGILDTTHLKMYTKTEICNLVNRGGFRIEQMCYTTGGMKPMPDQDKLIDKLTAMMEHPDRGVFLAYQYLVRAVKI